MRTSMTVQVEFDEAVTDAESVATALDMLLETALSTPGILDEHGDVTIGPSVVTPPEVQRFLTLSTAHVPLDEAQAADGADGRIDCGPHRVQAHDHGWVVFLSSLEPDETDQEPTWFRPIGDLARAHGAWLVNFDEAEDCVGGLPTYEWRTTT